MRSEIGLNNIALLSFGKFKMAETHINRILQNAEFVEFQQTNLLWKRSTWIDNKWMILFINKQGKEIDR
jgi:hypothetical protein